MPNQKQSGKAFEYALINEAYNYFILNGINANIVYDAPYYEALASFNVFAPKPQQRYVQAAIAALNHIIMLEPRLSFPKNVADILTLQLQPDNAGVAGDVRDVLFIRSTQPWEIGISAKNNHKALKHSRLSNVKDFGSSWVGVPCSAAYFAAIAPTFNALNALKAAGAKWSVQNNKHAKFYRPILDAFETELTDIDSKNLGIPQLLVSYLVGKFDFYKVMKRSKVVEILAFNINGTLGKSIGGHKAIIPIPKLLLPTKLIQFQMKPGSSDTLLMVLNHGWQLSFRIHNAESFVVPSLKFDINLDGNPAAMYSNHIPY